MSKAFELNKPSRRNDHPIADLLGLDISEYQSLSHTGFRAVNGLDGNPMHFYTVISPLNPEPLLKRLKPKMDKRNTVYVAAEDFLSRTLSI